MLYRILLKQYKRKYPVNETLTSLLRFALRSGVEEIGCDQTFITIKFKNGMTMTAWNHERYNGWLSLGSIRNARGKLFTWSRMMPSAKILWEIKRLI
jgi:hypothetical protein